MKSKNSSFIKQPEFGRKITELRKVNGFTQKELVEKCKIGIRTIQRIESGAVIPRSYTIKAILSALDYDLHILLDENDKSNTSFKKIKQLLIPENSLNESPKTLTKYLNIACAAGFVYFFLGIFEGIGDYYKYFEGLMIYNNGFYISLKVISLISFAFFMRGYFFIGNLYKNYLLKISSLLLIACSIMLTGYNITSLFIPSAYQQSIIGGFGVITGSLCIIYGTSLIRLQRSIGKLAKYAGVFEIVAGCFFLSLVLTFMGYLFLLPAEILEIVILFKVIEKQKDIASGVSNGV